MRALFHPNNTLPYKLQYMIKYILPLFTALALPFTSVMAQKAATKSKTATKPTTTESAPAVKGALFFEKTYVNLGTIKDQAEPIKVIYHYKNIGQGKVTISQIKPDCNCSKPQWDKKEIAFGQEGDVVLYFYPTGLSGDVTKTLTLFSNGEPDVTYLQVRAYVDSKFARIKETFTEKQGNVWFDSYQVRFDKLYTDAVDSAFRQLYNPTTKPIRIKQIKTPNHIVVTTDNMIIQPDNSVPMKFKYYATRANDYGSKLDEVLVYTDDSIEPLKKFLIRANLVEDFSKLTEKEKAAPPIFQAITPVVMIDTMPIKSTRTVTFYITNKGKSPLLIRKVYATCGCTKIEYNTNQPIKKNKKAAITVTYDSNYDLGLVEKQIYVITNTPDKALNELTLKANVMYIRKP